MQLKLHRIKNSKDRKQMLNCKHNGTMAMTKRTSDFGKRFCVQYGRSFKRLFRPTSWYEV